MIKRTLLLSLLLASGALQAQDSAPTTENAAAQGATIGAGVCMTCHGIDGNNREKQADGTFGKTAGGADSPKLAGQHAEYLYKQMRDFKAVVRQNGIMNGMIAMLPDEAAMKQAAEFYAGQKQIPASEPATKEIAETDAFKLGQKIWRAGVASKGIPACASCHGAEGKGMAAQYPALAGQYPDYVVTQLRAFRDEVRTNDPAKMMRDIAIKMTEPEIKAVADYAAQLR